MFLTLPTRVSLLALLLGLCVLASPAASGAAPFDPHGFHFDGHCDRWTPTAADQRSYHNFIVDFAQGIGTYRVVLFLEQDSLITVGRLSPEGVSIRMHELRDAINILIADCPHIVIYLDAGAADAIPAPETARLLLRAGVQKIQGFFLNATHFDWTLNEIHYGDAISRLIGGKHFTVTTGGNGQGPLVPQNRAKEGNEVLCNPPAAVSGPSRPGRPASRSWTRSSGSTTRAARAASACRASRPKACTGRSGRCSWSSTPTTRCAEPHTAAVTRAPNLTGSTLGKRRG